MRVEAAWLQLPLLLLPIQLTLLLQDLPGTALCYANLPYWRSILLLTVALAAWAVYLQSMVVNPKLDTLSL